jgi:hypothetical protein
MKKDKWLERWMKESYKKGWIDGRIQLVNQIIDIVERDKRRIEVRKEGG